MFQEKKSSNQKNLTWIVHITKNIQCQFYVRPHSEFVNRYNFWSDILSVILITTGILLVLLVWAALYLLICIPEHITAALRLLMWSDILSVILISRNHTRSISLSSPVLAYMYYSSPQIFGVNLKWGQELCD